MRVYFHIILAIITACLIVSLGIITHTGYKEEYFGYFLWSAIVAPLIVFALSNKTCVMDFIAGMGIILVVYFGAVIFWEYMDLQDECFSFENDLPGIYLFIWGGASMLLGMTVKLIKVKIRLKNDSVICK